MKSIFAALCLLISATAAHAEPMACIDRAAVAAGVFPGKLPSPEVARGVDLFGRLMQVWLDAAGGWIVTVTRPGDKWTCILDAGADWQPQKAPVEQGGPQL